MMGGIVSTGIVSKESAASKENIEDRFWPDY